MAHPFQDQIEQMQQQLRRQQEEFEQLRHRLDDVKATAMSKNRGVLVTVDSKGEVVDITFRSGAYRMMASAELSRILLDTIGAARRDARSKVIDQIAAIVPDMPIRDLVEHDMDFESLLAARIDMPDEVPADASAEMTRRAER